MKPVRLLLLPVLLSCAGRQGTGDVGPAGSIDPVVEQARAVLVAKHPEGARLAKVTIPAGSRSSGIEALLAALGDRSTRLLSAQAWPAFLAEISDQATTGVGLRELLDVDYSADGRVVVITTQPGGPAARAGLVPGDVIERVDGEAALGLGETMARLRGAAGTEVGVELQRGEERRIVTLRREALPPAEDHVRSGTLEGGIVHLAIDGFSNDTAAAAEKALVRGADRGVVLDLRNNPGGAVDAALAVAGLFLGERDVMRSAGKLEKPVLRSQGTARVRARVAVLLNAGTASAAELLAAALHDTGGARLFGESTAGKALVHLPAPLDDGSVLLISVGRVVRLDGTEILARGLTPDERVSWPDSVHPPLPVPGKSADDAQLRAALRWVSAGR